MLAKASRQSGPDLTLTRAEVLEAAVYGTRGW